jgi:SAM-dependent methyltransferase
MTMSPSARHDRRIISGIERYYATKLSRYGATPRGVDWTCVATQELRFVQLLKLCRFGGGFSLNDVGCGYGALLAHLAKRHPGADIDYLGIDLCPAMVRKAKRVWHDSDHARFLAATASPRIADYSIASGIFNVKLHQPTELWESFIATTIVGMHATSRRGFAINFMTPRQPDRTAEPELYRTTPDRWLRFCEQKLGSSAELLVDYGLREFTLLVQP